jgi:hypothetical protein
MSTPPENDAAGAARFSPREFLRARRPELFSDSAEEPVSELDRSLLEYHLSTLTSRSQELDFERFAFRLCEREVCPNLLPHTGPTGGGDSKVDAETYPVADALTFAWFTGNPGAAGERWGFAFSAMADWRDKVKSDVAKIAATGRNYRKVFFVTSQYVPDRVRAEVEDALSKEFHLDVRIFDRAWILDRVFGGHHEELTIAELKVTALTKARVVKGPRDAEAERAREEIEERIKAATTQQAFGHLFVDDCIEAARLARRLGRPRAEIEGCFQRARRAAMQHGTNHQALLAKYQEAWTTYWWFEDYPLFARLYGEAEKHVLGSVNPHELELLTNLWMVLKSLVTSRELDGAAAQLGAQTATLKSELERLSNEPDRPSASLQARTLRLNIDLLLEATAGHGERVSAILSELEGVIKECDGLVGFPLEPLVKIITELGKFLGDRPEYVNLFESVLALASRREGDATAARLLCQRGADQLGAKRYYDAIRSFGRALSRLYQHETRDEMVKALYLCANAYEHVGLLWAARGTLLTAAAVATNEFWTHEQVTFEQAACYHQLKWTELQLGRVPQTLAWHELDQAFQPILAQHGRDISRLTSTFMAFNGMLGILMLKADLWQLGRLSRLPAALDRLNLAGAELALRFSLGYEAEVATELSTEAAEGDKLHAFFRLWRDQPGAAQLPFSPQLDEGTHVELKSKILGCEIKLKCDAARPCIELAESVLAALESLLSTGLSERLISKEPVLTFRVRKADFVSRPFAFTLTEPEGRPHIEIRCGDFNPHTLSRDEQSVVKEKLFELLATVLARIFFHGDPEPTLKRFLGDERALERAVHFTSSFVTLGNVLGHNPKTTLDAWIRSDDPDYPLKRSEEWDALDRKLKATHSEPAVDPEIGKGTLPSDFQHEQVKQNEIATFSLIREPLWNRAEWYGAAFDWHPGRPPVLCLAFKNANPAFQIFSHWRTELGRYDREERLRIPIPSGSCTPISHASRTLSSRFTMPCSKSTAGPGALDSYIAGAKR